MKPNLLLISMFNTESLQEKKNLEEMFGIFKRDEMFLPTEWGHDERIRLDYDEKELVGKIISKENIFSDVYLYRKGKIGYSGYFDTKLTSKSFMKFEFKKSISKKYWKEIFEFSNMLAGVVKPRYGVTHIFWPPTIPWRNEYERMKRWMNICAQPTPVRWTKHGPMGVGMRTYLGIEIIELFGKDFLMNVPAVVSELDWGGICIDLVEKPWEAEVEEIVDVWTKVMDYLETAKVFAIPIFDEEGRGVHFEINDAWKLKRNSMK